MKVLIKQFAEPNLDNWGNPAVAKWLYELIKPVNLKDVLHNLRPYQIERIKKQFGSEPKKGSFKDIYNQFKSCKI